MELKRTWRQHPGNPLVTPPFPAFLVGDPVVLLPKESPDGSWHMFANTVFFIHHYVSENGIDWRRLPMPVCRGMRAFIFIEDGEFFLLNEHFTYVPFKSEIRIRRSKDLMNWTDVSTVLLPEQDWEKTPTSTVGNPCLVRTDSGYRLYYSCGGVFLPDLGFNEPLYIGCADSGSITGPYIHRTDPVISPDPSHPWRNRGAGSIKVYRDDANNRFVGFNNGIYESPLGRSGSAILVLTSSDGIDWKQEFDEPIIRPDNGWRRSLVYAMDVKEVDDELWIYYNAREGRRSGRERIGLEIGSLV